MPSYALARRRPYDREWSEFKHRFLTQTQWLPYRLPLAHRSWRYRWTFHVCLAIILLLTYQFIFNASYTRPTPFSIPRNETLFIAADISDADLIEGAWGDSLLRLVELVGRDNVYISIYGGPKASLQILEKKLPCATNFIAEADDPIALERLEHIMLPAGGTAVKRTAWLAELRNKALKPLDTMNRTFDKVLFMNDVFYNPMDAARLLWGTNIDAHGKASYKAACAVDFIAWWKFYDTFATRDNEGYSIGIPIFPWFGGKGEALSRQDVLAERDAVRVKSCWGGMVAYDGRYFQSSNEERSSVQGKDTGKDVAITSPRTPLRFRFEHESLWTASECCLINADLIALPPFEEHVSEWGDGIYMNPYVRVAYDAGTYSRLWFMKRFERLLSPLQALLNTVVDLPKHNYRRTEAAGEIIPDKDWVPYPAAFKARIAALDDINEAQLDWADRGSYHDIDRVADVSGYCGVRHISIMKDKSLEEGEKNWVTSGDALPPMP